MELNTWVREGKSSEWRLKRGLRGEFVISRVLLNVYYSNVIGTGREMRKKRMEQDCGIPWNLVPGNCCHQETSEEQVVIWLAKLLFLQNHSLQLTRPFVKV